MASMREVMSRPNVLIASTLVLALGSLFCYKYLSVQQPKQRSITKKPVSNEGESSQESEDVSEKNSTTTAPLESIASTKHTTEKSPANASKTPTEERSTSNDKSVEGTPVIKSIVTVQEELDVVPVVEPTLLTESAKTSAAEIPKQKESIDNTETSAQQIHVPESKDAEPAVEPIVLTEASKKNDQTPVNSEKNKLIEKHTGIIAANEPAEENENDEEIEQHRSEPESLGSEEPISDISSQGTTLDETSVPIHSAISSNSTSLYSSPSAENAADKTYPATAASTASPNNIDIVPPKSTGFWQQSNTKTMPQATSGGWHPLSAKEFKPQIQNNKGEQSQQQRKQQQPQRSSFYSVEAGNAIATELVNPTRKMTRRAVRKQMTRQELIQDQWQSHNASFKARCKFWPNCSNRNCKYKHPVKDCRWGDQCQFGDRCMFLHPSDLSS